MSKKIFSKSSEVESIDLFIAAIIQQRLVTYLLKFGSFEGFLDILENIIGRPFGYYIETKPVSCEESDTDSEFNIDDDVSYDQKD